MTLSPSHESRARNLDREQERQDREAERLVENLERLAGDLDQASVDLATFADRCDALANDAPDLARVKALRAEIEEYLMEVEL